MYGYDQYDHAMVEARVAEFRDQTRRRIAGQLTDDQFKPLRLKNGLYLQLHAYMLRVAIPYGTLSGTQMRTLADDRPQVRPRLRSLHHAAEHPVQLDQAGRGARSAGRSGRGRDARDPDQRRDRSATSRADQYAGAAADEVIDPRPWAEMIRQMTTFMPEFSYLPRKFKIAVIATPADRAALRWHDLAVRIVKNDAGRDRLRRSTRAAAWAARRSSPTRSADFPPTGQILSYMQAVLRVWNRNARRDNIHKQRMKILVHELGADEFRRQVEEEFQHFLSLRRGLPAGRVRPHRGLLRAAAVRKRAAGRDRPLRSRLRAVGRPPDRRAQGRRAMRSST